MKKVLPLMTNGACLAYSHGFNILEEGQRALAWLECSSGSSSSLGFVESLCAQHRSTLSMVTQRADEPAFWHARIGGAVLSLPLR